MKLAEDLGNADKAIRILISAVIAFLFSAEFIGGPLATGLLVFGVVRATIVLRETVSLLGTACSVT